MRKLTMILHTILFFVITTASMAQPVNADFFGVEDKISLNDTITWVSFSDVVAVDLKGQKVFWDVILYREAFTDTSGIIHFRILLNKRVGMDFPSQALPLKSLKSKMKDESAEILDLIYNGQEQ